MKPGIFTFTPNPVLDLGGSVEKVLPNEKVYVEDETRNPGGNAINSGRIVARLGGPVTLSGFLGGGVGTELKGLLLKEKLKTEFIKIQDDTRIGITVSSLDSHTQTRLSFRGPKVTASEKKAMFKYFARIPRGSLVLIGGSMPRGMGLPDLKRLLKICAQKNIPTIVDSPSEILRKLVKSRPFLIKPNLLEFQQLTGTRAKNISSVITEARKLTAWIPLVCVSSVQGGALLVSADDAWFGRIPKVKVNSVVGAGDSMVGAMAVQIWQQMKTIPRKPPPDVEIDSEFNLGEMLRWGLAASCASLSHRGTELGLKKEIEKFYKKTVVKKLGNKRHG